MSLHTSTWYAYIYNPRTQKTRRRLFRTRQYNANMSNARAVTMAMAKRFGVNDDYILAQPKRGQILSRRVKRRRTKHRRSR